MSMTENTAVEMIKYRIATASKIAGRGEDGKTFEDLEKAILALEEIQAYRELGTVEELKAIKSSTQLVTDILAEYSTIGTIEEFKALKNRNEHYSETEELDGYGYGCTNKTCVERIRNKAIDDVFDFLKTQRGKKYMRVNFDDLEIREYKEQLRGGAKCQKRN